MTDGAGRNVSAMAAMVVGTAFVLLVGWTTSAHGFVPGVAPNAKLTPPAQPLRAWTVAPDSGDVLVLDAGYVLCRLSSTDLAVIAQSRALFDAQSKGPAFLEVDDRRVFVGNAAAQQTLVLSRADFGRTAVLKEAGPMAMDPGRRLFVVSRGALVYYDLKNLGRAPSTLIPALKSGAIGDVPRDVVADPAGRRLYVRIYGAFGSPPHNHEFYAIYDLDTFDRLTTFDRQLANLSRVSLAEKADSLVIVDHAYSGFLGSALKLLDRQGVELRSARPIDGTPVIDAEGNWIYLLRERGLWVLNGGDLSCMSMLPFQVQAPAGLALSRDGTLLYLFGNGWLEAKNTIELQLLGVKPASPLPAAWISDPDPFLGPALFTSPQIATDNTAFVQVGGYGETYRTTDGGREWQWVSALTYPDFTYVLHLSFSPDFAVDRTLVALPGRLDTLLRSADAGSTWEFWTPRIAFVSDRSGNRDLYTMQQDGLDVRRLTDTAYAEENPAWSPGWTRLAFQGNRDGNWDIFTMKSDCGLQQDCELRQLTSSPADDMLPAWSPDGRTIAFVSTRDGNPEIYVMDSDGGNQRRLTFDPSGDWRPAWMPDSRRLVFTTGRAGSNDIYQLQVPVGAANLTAEPQITPVVTGPFDDRDPTVSASGILAFVSNRDGVMRAYRHEMNVPGSACYPVAEAIDNEGHPSWVDDAGVRGGGLLVSTERDGATNIFTVNYPDRYTPLTNGNGFDGHPAWGPTWWRPDSKLSREQLKAYAK